MAAQERIFKSLFWGGALFAATLIFPFIAECQNYPDKPITIFCSYVAGATTNVTTRALALESKKS